MIDYLVVGSGMYGAVVAQKLYEAGKSVLVLERRSHIGGNVYTEKVEGINVHKYGAHIFHTNDKVVWEYVQRFATFNRFTNSQVANYKGDLYSMPFNMYTFNKMWGVVTPEEAERQRSRNRERRSQESHKTLKSRPSALSVVTSTRSLLKDIPRNSGGEIVKTFQLSSLSGFQFGLLSTITTLTPFIKAYISADTRKWLADAGGH